MVGPLRHDLRDLDTGQFRPRTPAEAHAQAVREALANKQARKASLIGTLTGRNDPLHGFTPVTTYQPHRPLPAAFAFTRLDA